MRSGNGRHRRPRQAPALVVAAGVTGSAMALPLLATGSASAADAATWDRVAECESGGQWSANFGNGMYGGLQFTQDSWERHGGLAYAPSPDLASRAQQIAVAEKALAKGSNDWATCAPIAGLTNDGTAPGVDPGPANLPKAPTGPVPESNWTTGLPGASGTAADATKQAGEATTAPGAGTGKHRGEAAPEESGKPDSSSESGRHASSANNLTEKPLNTPSADAAKKSGATDSQGNSDAYTVQPGDSLSDIAQENELPGGWTALYDANRQIVGVDPDLILPGQSLDLTNGSLTKAE
ncbi:transglycosylase family protein [Streptomyces venezuelae]|uniref:transglycosylase family protein n=1 Tax=Streptomyces venezuelae TaxID=54571 RepID=UPI0026760B19|nr:transglycosylase family protein [Streptomyces venezuelae]